MLQMYLDKHQSQQGITHTKKAQALVITLLVLAIISIVVIGIIVISNRDQTQVLNNEKYERLFNESERRIREIVQTNGISTLPGTCGSPAVFPGYTEYTCGTVVQASDTLSATVDTKIVDRKAIVNYPIAKDKSLDIALNGYSGEIQFTWSKAMAMEFNIIYTTPGGVVRSIRDVYDRAGVFDSLVGDDPTNDVNNIHDINFQVQDSNNLVGSTKFTISATNGISLGSTISLRVTPRSKTAGDAVNLFVTASNEASFPLQMREFIVSSIDAQDTQSPLASLISRVPLNAQSDDLFDYSLLVNGNLIQ